MKTVNCGKKENKRKKGNEIKKSFCKIYIVHFRALISLFRIKKPTNAHILFTSHH
jgi:hypothetical protein